MVAHPLRSGVAGVVNIFRTWLTRPATPAEAARALSNIGHTKRRLTRDEMTARLQAEINAKLITPIAPRSEVVAGARKVRA